MDLFATIFKKFSSGFYDSFVISRVAIFQNLEISKARKTTQSCGELPEIIYDKVSFRGTSVC